MIIPAKILPRTIEAPQKAAFQGSTVSLPPPPWDAEEEQEPKVPE